MSSSIAVPAGLQYEGPFDGATATETPVDAPYARTRAFIGERAAAKGVTTKADLPAQYRRIADVVSAYDAKEIALNAQRMHEKNAAAVSADVLRHQSKARTEQLKRQITTLAFREGIGADEVAMLAGILVGAFIAGGFGIGGAGGAARRRDRADHINKYLDRCRARVDAGEPFLPVPFGGKLLGDKTVEHMNAWFTDSFEPKMREYAYGNLAEKAVPVSLETLGNYGIAIQLDAFDRIAKGQSASSVTVDYQRQFTALRKVAAESGVNDSELDAAINLQMVRMTDEHGFIDVQSMIKVYGMFGDLEGAHITPDDARIAAGYIAKYQVPSNQPVVSTDAFIRESVLERMHFTVATAGPQDNRAPFMNDDDGPIDVTDTAVVVSEDEHPKHPLLPDGADETKQADVTSEVDRDVVDDDKRQDAVDVESDSELESQTLDDLLDQSAAPVTLGPVQAVMSFSTTYDAFMRTVDVDGQTSELLGITMPTHASALVFDCGALENKRCKEAVLSAGYKVYNGLTQAAFESLVSTDAPLVEGRDPTTGAPVVYFKGFEDFKWRGELAGNTVVTDTRIDDTTWASQSVPEAVRIARDAIFAVHGVRFVAAQTKREYVAEHGEQSMNTQLNSTDAFDLD